MTRATSLEGIECVILLVRGRHVMLDADLAALYGVTTRQLNQQVKRNRLRFPDDFVFQLSEEVCKRVNGTFPRTHGGRRYIPYAFTEPGAGMLASVLRSPAATRATIEILRAFKRLRQEDEPESLPVNLGARDLFAAIRDAVLCLPGEQEYTTEVPYTYFIQAGKNGPIKVGWTRNLPVRLRTLCSMSPEPLKLLGVMKGVEVEEFCHARFGAFRLHGEWFAPSPVILGFIRKNAITPASYPSHQC